MSMWRVHRSTHNPCTNGYAHIIYTHINTCINSKEYAHIRARLCACLSVCVCLSVCLSVRLCQIMIKLQELGLVYLEEESARIDRLLKTNLPDEKTNQLTRRRYIISDFIARANKLKKQ
jgi:hypothetical protein